MKKQLLIASALLVSAISFAQKDELKAAEKALKGGNSAEAKAALESISAQIANADEKTKAQFYYLKGKAYYDMAQKGDASAYEPAVKAYQELIALEEGSKAKKYTTEVKGTLQNISASLVNEAIKDNSAKDYAAAAKKLYMAYELDKNNKDYLYYAASSAVSGGDYDTALKHYLELKEMGYTGVTTQYIATNVETGKEDVFSSKNERDLMVKAKSHTNPKEQQSESRLPEIVKNIALIYTQQGDNEKAITAIQEARAQNPKDINLLLTEANLYVKLDDKAKFGQLMEEAIQQDPNNAVLYYNLGVITAEQGDKEKAKGYYQKAIELDPTAENPYLNMASLILGEEGPIVDEMNSLGSSKADNLKYDQLKLKREELYKSAIPYLSKIMDINPKNVDAVRTLMNIYANIGDTANFKAMKEKLEALEQ